MHGVADGWRARTTGYVTTDELHKVTPIRAFDAVEEWQRWLELNHDRCSALWVKLAKKDSGIESISYEEARDHAIAFGWIDGLKSALDDRFYAIRLTPRGARSKWSKILYHVLDAKRPETRARRIEKYISMLTRGEVPHPDR